MEEKRNVKPGLMLAVIGTGITALPVMLLLLLFAGGGGDPMPVSATKEKAYEYQYACSELGAPWDIIMLADVFRAYRNKKSDIEDYNPIITGLEFCKLKEDKYVLVTHTNDDGTTSSEWEYDSTIYYEKSDAILSYAGQSRQTLSYREVVQFLVALQDAAAKKGDGDTRYEVCLENYTETEYPEVLDFLALHEEEIDGAIELYEARYLPQLYGFDDYMPAPTPGVGTGITELPAVTVGNVTREELLQVAASLINYPYLFGGKSAYKGAPRGPLDCSGYVDWVYFQCFGKTIAGGGGTASQFYNSEPIPESELKPGDLGFAHDPRDCKTPGSNHIGIYVGEIDGRHAWIHCGGKSYGTESLPNGRVGISTASGKNDKNPISGGTFAPPMNRCNFTYFRRPRFIFAGEEEDQQYE